MHRRLALVFASTESEKVLGLRVIGVNGMGLVVLVRLDVYHLLVTPETS